MLFALLASVALSQVPPSQCVSTSGNAACGYDCKTTSGQAACAQTPWGACVTTSGQIFCNDPPYEVLNSGLELPQMECVTTSGIGACGYDCKTTSGKAACAQTPWGRCVTTSGKIFCGDPAPYVLRAGPPPPIQCVTTSGVGACGYDCKTTSGKARCASEPWGRCIAASGQITCTR